MIFIFPACAESGHIVLIILFIDDDDHILRPFKSQYRLMAWPNLTPGIN